MASTMKDIARTTGLGLATISKYLNGGNVRPENRLLIENAIAALNYTPNIVARSLKTRHSRTIGVIIPELANAFMTEIITCFEDTLRKNDYSVIVCDCRSNKQLEKEAVSFLLHKQVDGIVNIPTSTSGKHLEAALERGIPVVLVDRMIQSLFGRVSAVIIDNRNASQIAMQQLLQAGHRRIGIILGEKDVYTAVERKNGYLDSLVQAGIEPDEALIQYAGYNMQGGYLSIGKLMSLPEPPTAVFCTNYEITLGARIALNEQHIRIPEDLSFIGFDDMDMTKAIFPNTTLIRQPMDAIAGCAAERILALLSGKEMPHQTVTLSTTLKQGTTIAPYRF